MEVIRILLVEDNPADVRLTQKSMEKSKIANVMDVVMDGEAALEHLEGDRPRPDLILLDLNLPKLSGLEVLAHIKKTPRLCRIPVVMLTTSSDETDVLAAYEFQANSYVTKPPDLRSLKEVLTTLQDYWFAIVRFPPQE